jgi:signal transduction histidine kinase
MPTADDSPDGFVYDAADQLRHDLLTPVTTISARIQLLARDIRRAPSLTDAERTRMLTAIASVESALQAMCGVIDAIEEKHRGR